MTNRSETWFITKDVIGKNFALIGRKFFKRVSKYTPWKKFKDHGTSGCSSKYIEHKETEISKKEFLEHKCIDCFHPGGVEEEASLIRQHVGVGDGTDGYDGYC